MSTRLCGGLLVLLAAFAACVEVQPGRAGSTWASVDPADDTAGFIASSDTSSDSGAMPEDGAELCNGVDDDDDGEIDEALGEIVCGVGECAVVEPACIGGVGVVCTPEMQGVPLAESCNGLDDDCDGVTDEDVCGESETGSTSLSESSGSESAAVDEGEPPGDYAPCLADGDCPDDEHCVTLLGYCSRDCAFDDACPVPGDGTAPVGCVESTGTCYLVCSIGSCPAAMTCSEDGLCRHA
jgi:hypothetical protein